MSYNPNAAGGEVETEGRLAYNLRRLDEIIDAMQAPFRDAIVQGDGSEPHHTGEILQLESVRRRLRFDMIELPFLNPIDEDFVRVMRELLDVEEYSGQSPGTDFRGWMQRGELLDAAYEESRGEKTAA